MKTIKYIFRHPITLILALAILGSCSDDFFDTETGGRIDPSKHYKSYLDADLSYTGAFTFLQEIAEKQVLVDGLRSDQIDITANSDREMIDIYRHNLTSDNQYLDPAAYYKMIININETLPNLAQILSKDRDFDQKLYENFKGALVTMRCWAYFTLAKLNGEVGMVDEDISNFDPSKPPTYLSKDEIINVLINELLKYYDEKDIYRYAIDHYILLGELYLEKNDYSNAARFLKYACDGPFYRVAAALPGTYGLELWQNLFINSFEQSLFTAVPYSYVNGQRNYIEEWTNYEFAYKVKPTSLVIHAFENETQKSGDPGDIYRGYGITYDSTSTGEAYISKYSLDKGIPHSADVILYRVADVHLLLAEALNRQGLHDYALYLLNDGFSSMVGEKPADYTKWSRNKGVRGRVYLDRKKVPASVENTTEYIEDLIMEERFKELAFEGKRWFDLVRIATRRNDPSYLADRVSAKYSDPAEAEAIRTKLMDPANWYLPIPKVE
ncbi:MAG: RagB/SusD family nutrient uptake outer membrane protein [Bacteroidales bacterium]|nr:RagB/SusD family nutrient uptake outer membrane protein [Bacteroidales bacterium]MBN2817459.1 RagB/SusD family nutrient uptake outer membrane protein [Bacteroidales bacterium]